MKVSPQASPMKEVVLEKPNAVESAEIPDVERKSLNRWRRIFFFSMLTGIVSAVTGLLLGALSYTRFFRHAELMNQTGNFLIIAAFALMMLGAHALDKINEHKYDKK